MTQKDILKYRHRLRERFLLDDPASRSEAALLELLLTFAVTRTDVKLLAQELIRVFGSLSKVLFASETELSKVKGLGQSAFVLLKVVALLRADEKVACTEQSGATLLDESAQQERFTNLKTDQIPEPSTASLGDPRPMNSSQCVVGTQSVIRLDPSEARTTENNPSLPRHLPRSSQKQATSHENNSNKSDIAGSRSAGKRKFQVSRSHVLEFNHFSRILTYLYQHLSEKRIQKSRLIEYSGLPYSQVDSLLSIGAAIGLIQSGEQILTPIGLLIAEHDLFIEDQGALEWCHYIGAGSYKNLVWFEVFNHLLAEEAAVTQEGWHAYFHAQLSGAYTLETIKDHVQKEVRFILDAYTRGNFSKLELIDLTPDDHIYRRRYSRFRPLVLSAMIYDFGAKKQTSLFQIGEMTNTPGSPAMVFGLDTALFKHQLEGLHNRGWLRYETTHNLDQIRLKSGYSPFEFLSAYFENREPHEETKPSPGGGFL